MDRQATLGLFALGQKAWNDWADDLLDRKTVLEQSKSWKLDAQGEPATTETEAWWDDAYADFSSDENPETFRGDMDFSGFKFPGMTSFERAMFEGEANFSDARFSDQAAFINSLFKRGAEFDCTIFNAVIFDHSRFENSAAFSESRFFGNASFGEIRVQDYLWFGGCKFKGDANFKRSHFNVGVCDFSRCCFNGRATLDDVKFIGPADFSKTHFAKEVSFDLSTFHGYASFQDGNFLARTSFAAIRSERAFSLADAKFVEVPNFIQAHFIEAPRLDNIDVSRNRNPFQFHGNDNLPARWRALKRLAIQGHDSEREHIFSPMEIRSSRFITDWPIPIKPWRSSSVLHQTHDTHSSSFPRSREPKQGCPW